MCRRPDRGGEWQKAGSSAICFAILCGPTLHCTISVIEANPIRARIDDLSQRLQSLRGYL